MKIIYSLSVFCAVFLFQSCYNPGDIQVQNKISNVEITDVKWGDIYIATGLLPGETSENFTIYKYEKKLPSNQIVSFKMYANQKSIYLETEEKYLLDEDGDLLITLTDETKVSNPNE